MKQVLKFIVELIFPTICEGCGDVGSYLCERCISKLIIFKENQECHVCKKQVSKGFVHTNCREKTSLDGVFVVADYSKFIEDYIGDIKYEFYFSMIDDLVKVMIEGLYRSRLFNDIFEESVFTYVPISKKRKRWRGFNQAELMANRLSEHFGSDCMRLLNRIKDTKSQVGLSRTERLENLDEAFACNEVNEFTQNIILVDDIMTSGATLEECAKVLKSFRKNKVFGLVFARG